MKIRSRIRARPQQVFKALKKDFSRKACRKNKGRRSARISSDDPQNSPHL
jgi:hypothetical protein